MVWLTLQILLVSVFWVHRRQKSRFRPSRDLFLLQRSKLHLLQWLKEERHWFRETGEQCGSYHIAKVLPLCCCYPNVKIFSLVCYITGFNCSPSWFDNGLVCEAYSGLCATQSGHVGFCLFWSWPEDFWADLWWAKLISDYKSLLKTYSLSLKSTGVCFGP